MNRESVMHAIMALCWSGAFFFVGMKFGEQHWRGPCLAVIEDALRQQAPAATKKEGEGHE